MKSQKVVKSKRRVDKLRKSNFQRQSLMAFYNEHKGIAPKKSAFTQLAKRVNLSENQIYKWFWDTKKKNRSLPQVEVDYPTHSNDKIFSDLAIEVGIDVEMLAAQVIDAPSPTGRRQIITKVCPSFGQAFANDQNSGKEKETERQLVQQAADAPTRQATPNNETNDLLERLEESKKLPDNFQRQDSMGFLDFLVPAAPNQAPGTILSFDQPQRQSSLYCADTRQFSCDSLSKYVPKLSLMGIVTKRLMLRQKQNFLELSQQSSQFCADEQSDDLPLPTFEKKVSVEGFLAQAQ